jgi:hypothetical protein
MENWESKSMVVEKIADDLSKKKKNADYVIGWLLVITCETLFQKGNAWPDAISVCESLGLIRKTEKPFGFPSFFLVKLLPVYVEFFFLIFGRESVSNI